MGPEGTSCHGGFLVLTCEYSWSVYQIIEWQMIAGRTRSKRTSSGSFGEDKGDSELLPKVECDDSLPNKVSLTDVKGSVLLPVLPTDIRDGESSTSEVKDTGDNVCLLYTSPSPRDS